MSLTVIINQNQHKHDNIKVIIKITINKKAVI